jgi:hypothetical protein
MLPQWCTVSSSEMDGDAGDEDGLPDYEQSCVPYFIIDR